MIDETRLFELLVELHAGQPRKGPGSAASTRRALSLASGLPPQPEILDVGAGAGAQTLELARATGGRITAVDLAPTFLAELVGAAGAAGLAERVRVVRADMRDLPFMSDRFDLVWSEGAISIMGFDTGLAAWRSLLRAGGCLAVTELSWFGREAPEPCRTFWRRHYPTMRTVDETLAAARRLGWEPLGHFPLPPTDWTVNYYGPLAEGLEAFRRRHAGDPAALEVVETTETEIDLFDRYHAFYGYEFYVLRRSG